MSAPLRRAWLKGRFRTASPAGKPSSEPGLVRLVRARPQSRRSAGVARRADPPAGVFATSPPAGRPSPSGPGAAPPLRGSAFVSFTGSVASSSLVPLASCRAFSRASRAGDPAPRAGGSGGAAVGAAGVPLPLGRASLPEALGAPGLEPAAEFPWLVLAAAVWPLVFPGRVVGAGRGPPLGGGRGAAGGRGMLPVS
jgi:hypothetical protein